MKKLIQLSVFMTLFAFTVKAQVSINLEGNDPDASAMLDISSSNKGLLIPRLSTTERTSIISPANGLIVFDTTTNSFWYYQLAQSAWQEISANSGSQNPLVSSLGDLSDVLIDGSNMFVGKNAGQDMPTNNENNLAFGIKSMERIISGKENVAFGNHSLVNNSSGNENSVFGYGTMHQNSTGTGNTSIGYISGGLNTTGSYNVFLGFRSGASCKTGDKNVFLGSQAGFFEEGSNKLYIENSTSGTPLIGGDFKTDEVTINGTLQITGGTPGIGKVLTSDDQGKASWQSIGSSLSALDDLSDITKENNNLVIGANEKKSITQDYAGNTIIGIGNFDNNVDGHYNTSTGYATLSKNTSGNHNSAYGFNVLNENISGEFNVALGNYSLLNNTSGNQNVAIGAYSGGNNISGSGNIFLGYYAGASEKGSNKLYIENSGSTTPLIGGDFSTNEVTINGELTITDTLHIEGAIKGSNITFDSIRIKKNIQLKEGKQVLTLTSTHGDSEWQELNLTDMWDAYSDTISVFIGRDAGFANTHPNNSGQQNVGVGIEALYSNRDGSKNTAVGFNALYANTKGNNTAIGTYSLRNNEDGISNVSVGAMSLYNNTNGGSNTAVGFGAGSQSTGSGNVFIGKLAGQNETGDNKLYIDNRNTSEPLIHGDFEDDKLTVNGDLIVSGEVKLTEAKTFTKHYAPESFQIDHYNSTDNFGFVTGGMTFKDYKTGGGRSLVQLDLPTGATITEIKVYHKSSSYIVGKPSISAKLTRRYLPTFLNTTLAEATAEGSANGNMEILKLNNFQLPVVSNSHSYIVQIDQRCTDDQQNMTFYGIIVSYTMDKYSIN